MAHYDVNGVVAALLNHEIPQDERAELITEIGAAVRGNSRPVLQLIAQITDEALKQPSQTPVNVVRIGILYGLVIGILLEKERISREWRPAV